MSTPPRTPTRRLRRTDSGRSGSASSGRVPEPPAHAVAARLAGARSGSASSGRSSRPRAVGVAVDLADGLDRVEVTAADVERPPWWDPRVDCGGGSSFWIARVLGQHGRAPGEWVADEAAAAAAQVESGRG